MTLLKPLLAAALSLPLMAGCSNDDERCRAHAESASFETNAAAPGVLLMNGVIDCTTQQKLNDALQRDSVTKLVMGVVDGSVDDEANIAMAKELAGRKLPIEVAAGGLIASGGVDFFLAGAERSIGAGALVGVHSWAEGEGGREGIEVYRQNPNDPNHFLYIEYYDQYVSGLKDGRPGNDIPEAPRDFYVYTLEAAPAAGLHCMTAQELVDWGMVTNTTDPAELSPVVKGGGADAAESCTH